MAADEPHACKVELNAPRFRIRFQTRSSNAPIMRLFLSLALVLFAACAFAQDNYEIQVYGSDTVPKGDTMVELHTNVTPTGHGAGTVRPTNHAVHETLEITHGWNDW